MQRPLTFGAPRCTHAKRKQAVIRLGNSELHWCQTLKVYQQQDALPAGRRSL